MESPMPNKGVQNSICFIFYIISYSCSARVNPSNSCVRKSTQTHCSMEPQKSSMLHSQNAKTISAQGNKLCSIKASLIFPNPSSLKTSRYGVRVFFFFFFKPLFKTYWLIFVRSRHSFLFRGFGGKQVLLSTGGVQEKKLSEQATEARQRSKKFDIGYCAENPEKQKLPISNMKRKALEVYIFSS